MRLGRPGNSSSGGYPWKVVVNSLAIGIVCVNVILTGGGGG